LKKLRLSFPAVLALALAVLASASVRADDPPELKLPELKPTIVKAVVKASADAIDPPVKLLNPAPAWKITKGAGVTLYVADTGLDSKHVEFTGLKTRFKNFTNSPDPDISKHGTHVSGIACGRASVDGLAPEVDELVMLKVLGDDGRGNMDWLEQAIRWTIKDAGGKRAVFNASLGTGPDPAARPGQVLPGLRSAIRDGIAAGIVFVFAAGNDNSKTPPNSVGFPARYAELTDLADVVVVAACNTERQITGFSSVGPATRVTACGDGVLGPLPGGQYGRWPGTSMASPMIAGLACLYLSGFPSIPTKDRQKTFAEALRKASSFPDQRNPARGFGLPDAEKLLAGATKPGNPPGPPVPPKDREVVVETAELRGAGIKRMVLTLDGAAAPTVGPVPVPAMLPVPQPTPVPAVSGTIPFQVWPTQPAPQPVAPPTQIRGPVHGYHQPPVAHPWTTQPTYPVPQRMPILPYQPLPNLQQWIGGSGLQQGVGGCQGGQCYRGR
jgi:hypothetical protein